MARSNSIIIGVSTDMRDAVRGFRDLGRATRNNLTTTQKWARGLRAASYVAGSALIAMAIYAKKAINDASDLAEAYSKNENIFENFYKNNVIWAEDAADKLGLSNKTALDAVATYGKLFTGIGYGDKSVMQLSQRFVQLTSDLSSFENMRFEDVFTNMQSGLIGEAEAVRKFGISLSDAALREEALGIAMAKYSGGTLTDRQKKLAAISIIMREMKDPASALGKTTGDFAKTSEYAANSQRRLQAEMENLSAELGGALLPAYQWVLQALIASVQWVKENSAVVKIAAATFGALAVSVLGANGALYVYNSRVAMATLATKLFNFALKANPIIRVISIVLALVSVIGALTVGFSRSSEISKKLGKYWNESLKPIVADMIPIIKEIGRIAVYVLETVVTPLLKNVVVPMFESFRGILMIIVGVLKGDFSTVWEGIKKLFVNNVKAIVGALQTILTGIKELIPKALAAFVKLGRGMLSAIKEALGGLADWLVSQVTNAIPRILAAVRGSLVGGIKGILNAAVPGNPFMVPDIPTLEGDARNRSQPVTLNVTGQASVDRMMTEEAVAQALYRILRRSDARHGELWAA